MAVSIIRAAEKPLPLRLTSDPACADLSQRSSFRHFSDPACADLSQRQKISRKLKLREINSDETPGAFGVFFHQYGARESARVWISRQLNVRQKNSAGSPDALAIFLTHISRIHQFLLGSPGKRNFARTFVMIPRARLAFF